MDIGSATGDRRTGKERRLAQHPFEGEDRRKAERRSGIDRRQHTRRAGDVK